MTDHDNAVAAPGHRLEALPFANSFARLPGSFHARTAPTPVPNPHMVSANPAAAALIGLAPGELERGEFVDYFSGNRPLPGSEPLAALYAGHQFGVYVPQLGDGRALLLGEVRGPDGQRWELQLKGAGPTPFSRGGDGRAVLRSTIREYLCSEAMHGLGIPTTRALCITGTDLEVWREEIESGAVLTRLAPSHLRFGSFEVFFYRGQRDRLTQLADYAIAEFFPELDGAPSRYRDFFETVVRRTARLVAQWQAVGFAHGVMNTDNMSILGLTIDYGPFGFMDRFDPGFVCNHSDHSGRYAFDRQPEIALWNLTCLAQALSPLVPVEDARKALGLFEPVFASEYLNRMCAKLGLIEPRREDATLVLGLLEALHQGQADYTGFFRALGTLEDRPGSDDRPLHALLRDPAPVDRWLADYRARLADQPESAEHRRARMNAVNPKYVLRNYLAEIAIRKAREGDFAEVDQLLALLAAPFDEQPEREAYAAPPPDWAAGIAVSCSS